MLKMGRIVPQETQKKAAEALVAGVSEISGIEAEIVEKSGIKS